MYAGIEKKPRREKDTQDVYPTAGKRDKPTKASKPVRTNINDGVKQVTLRPGNI